MMRHVRAAAQSAPTRLIIFEPQPQFKAPLTAIANDNGGVLVPAAAWIKDTKLTFKLNGNSEAGTLFDAPVVSGDKVLPSNSKQQRELTVPAVDLAKYLLDAVPERRGNSTFAFLKLDIEGAEYDVIPRLLGMGVFCRFQFVMIEWHLSYMPIATRATGVATMGALRKICEQTCPGGSPYIAFDELPVNSNISFGARRGRVHRLGEHHQILPFRQEHYSHLERLVSAIKADNRDEMKNTLATLKNYTIPASDLNPFKPELPGDMWDVFVCSVSGTRGWYKLFRRMCNQTL